MEKKQRVKLTVGILFAVALVVLLVLAVTAPYGADYNRDSASRVLEGNQGGEEGGIYLAAAQAQGLEAEAQPSQDGDAILLEKGSGSAQWSFQVEQSGDYYLSAGYMALEGNGQELEFDVLVDGEKVTDTEMSVTLTRIWSDSGIFSQTAAGDEIRPSQSEVELWMEEPFRLGKKDRISVWLEAGEHTLSIQSTGQSALINYVRWYQESPKSYQEYLAGFDGKNVDAGYYQQVEAETPALKSSSLLYAIYDRSSPYTLPYHATCLRYNTLGGTNWSDSGQWVEWQVEAPEDGFYQLGLRYRQNENKGQSSLRRLEIDGQVPFAEAQEIAFDYDIDWQAQFLGNGTDPYLFYLTKGTHEVRMEVVLGEAREVADQMEGTLYDVNSLYREIIMITGTSPDIYRDYALETAIPDLLDKLQKSLSEIQSYIEYLESRYGQDCYSSRILKQIETQILSFLDKPYTIANRLSVFKTNIEALAEWILEFEEQPLQVDYFYLTGVGANNPVAESGFIGRLGHEVRTFIGSFSHSYNEVSSDESGEVQTTLTVWMGKGRDQANVMKRLIDVYFTPQTGIGVNISLVEGALVKATLAGQGPDVNIFTTRGEAMNLAFRGAIRPLNGMDGFDELKTQYSDSAFVPYEYEGVTYAIPETQEFYVMYIRTDVFEDLGIEIPNTWEELMALLPILQANSLSIGLPYTDGYATMNSGIGTINLLPTLLAQRNIPIYQESEEGTVTRLTDSDAYDSFEQWVNFYVQYDFDLYKDDFNRFRTGEMPIVISTYALYNNLSEAAPEIAGQWVMAPIPGTVQEDGTINRATSASGTCSIILENCKDKEAAWKFLEWWSSAEVQQMYAAEIETELSTLGRHTPANLEAFQNSYWTDDEKALLLEQWKNVVEVPEIPGGYYVSRNVDNAFRQVYYNGENARDTLYYWMNAVNEELLRKQDQLEARKGE